MMRVTFNKAFGQLLKQNFTKTHEQSRDHIRINIDDKMRGKGGLTLLNFIAICHYMGWSEALITDIVKHLMKVYENEMAKQNWLHVKRKKRSKKP